MKCNTQSMENHHDDDKSELEKLQRENRRLGQMVSIDGLTGIYNRLATEQKIDALIQQQPMGALMILDVDYFKQINDRYGHIAGDRVLQHIALTIGKMVRKSDVLGRVGGDEFVVFIPIKADAQFAEARCNQIAERVKCLGKTTDISFGVSVTLGYAIYQPEDSYQTLFDRADQMLIHQKHIRGDRATIESSVLKNDEKSNMHFDVRRIRKELSEQERIDGAYCQDYDTFKILYRFTARRLLRTNGEAGIILFTLTDGNDNLSPLTQREKYMPQLAERIQYSLRAGDVFTQYSSGQFLVMLADVSLDLTELIANRIKNLFYAKVEDVSQNILLHHCYPMTSAQLTHDIDN